MKKGLFKTFIYIIACCGILMIMNSNKESFDFLGFGGGALIAIAIELSWSVNKMINNETRST